MKRHIVVLMLLSVAASADTHHTTLNLATPSTTGIASWYGTFHQGRRMSNGKRYDRHKYTCASRTYKLGTVLMVTFPKKGTFVEVTVTDRGPYRHPGRVIDLSEHAAQVLGLKPYGLGSVKIEPVHLNFATD